MSSLSSGVNLALRALMANQQAIEVIEQNVANSNTPGYRRQSAVMTTGVSYSTAEIDHGKTFGQMGSGVEVDRIQRFSTDFFDGRFRQVTADSKNWNLKGENLKQLEGTLAETSTSGLLPNLDEFWAGWQTLASDPSNISKRQILLDQASALASAFNDRAEKIDAQRVDLNQGVTQRVDEINSLASRIADLNKEISHQGAIGQQANNLLDQRDLILDRMSEIGGAVSYPQANGEVMVSLGGHIILSNQSVFPLSTVLANNGTIRNIVDSEGQAVTPPSGELAGMMDVRDRTLPSQLAGLNQVASTLITAVNNLHASGVGSDGVTGRAFFTGNDAASIRVNGTLLSDPSKVATGKSASDPGDSSIANSIAGLAQTAKIPGTSQTLSQFYNSQVTGLGLDVERAASNATQRQSALTALETQRESVSGVNLDEEAANLVKYQRAYQAATRMMNAVDEMLDQVINNMGLVGR
jgi:flagellar hook-associated protein 1